MRGTEKQIAWAEELKVKAIAALDWMLENPSDDGNTNPEMWAKGIEFQKNRINSVEHAGQLIDALKLVDFGKAPDVVGMNVVVIANRYLRNI